jgi:hypothetical protein
MYGLPIMTPASTLVRSGSLISQNSADNNELKPMLEKAGSNLGQKPPAVLADRGCLNGPVVEQIQDQGIEPMWP